MSLIELLEFYNNYPESNHRLPASFMKEWNHVKVYFDKEQPNSTPRADLQRF